MRHPTDERAPRCATSLLLVAAERDARRCPARIRFHRQRLPGRSGSGSAECRDLPARRPDARSRRRAKPAPSESWWQTVSSTQLARAEYAATPTSDGLQAPNRAHNLRTMFGARGIEVVPRTGKGALRRGGLAGRRAVLGARVGCRRSPRRPLRPRAPASSTSGTDGASGTRTRRRASSRVSRSTQRPAGEGPLRIVGGSRRRSARAAGGRGDRVHR